MAGGQCPRRQLGIPQPSPVGSYDIEMLREVVHLRLPHSRIGHAGVQHQDRKTRALTSIVDKRAVDPHLHVRAVSSTLNFNSVSSSSRAASESGITPTPA